MDGNLAMQFSPGDLVWVVKEPDKMWTDPKTGYTHKKANGFRFKAVVLELFPKSVKVRMFNDKGNFKDALVNPIKLQPRKLDEGF